MEWRIYITRWILLDIRYSGLLWINFKKAWKKISEDNNPSVKIYINKIENSITFKIKNGYSLELLTKEIMKLLGSTKSKITKDKNGENAPHLEITEVVLVHCNMVNNVFRIHEYYILLFQINLLIVY